MHLLDLCNLTDCAVGMRCDVWYYKKHYYFFILFSLTQVQSMLQFPLVARTFFLHLYLFTCPDTASCKQELVIVLQILDVGWIEFRINTVTSVSRPQFGL